MIPMISISSRSEGILHSRYAELGLTEDEHAELVRVVRQAIDGDRFFLAPRAKRLRSILSKRDPASKPSGATFDGVRQP